MNSKLIPFRPLRHAAVLGNGDHAALSSVAIVGLGYVGLPTAAALHGECERIIGIDTNEQRLSEIAALEADLGEPDLLRLKEALAEGTLELTTDLSAASAADAVIICVPTPVDAEQTPDLAALRSACASVVSHARPGQVIILTSTTYVGTTTELLTVPLAERGLVAGTNVDVAFSPGADRPGQPRSPAAGDARAWSAAPPRHAPPWPPSVIGRLTDDGVPGQLLRTRPRRPSCTRTSSARSRWRWPTSSPTRAARSGSTRSRSRWPPAPSRTVSSACSPGPAWAATASPATRTTCCGSWARDGHKSPLIEQAMRSITLRPERVVRRAAEMPRGRWPRTGRVPGHRHRRRIQGGRP